MLNVSLNAQEGIKIKSLHALLKITYYHTIKSCCNILYGASYLITVLQNHKIFTYKVTNKSASCNIYQYFKQWSINNKYKKKASTPCSNKRKDANWLNWKTNNFPPTDYKYFACTFYLNLRLQYSRFLNPSLILKETKKAHFPPRTIVKNSSLDR